MNEEEKQAIEYLKHSIFEYEEIDTSVMEYIDKNHKNIYKLILKQQKEIEELKEKHKKVIAIFKKYGLDEKEYFFSSTSDIIKFVKDMRKLMGIGE